MKCPACGLVGRDAEGNRDGISRTPPIGALVLCECGAVNMAEAVSAGSALDPFLTALGDRKLRTLSAEEFDRLPLEHRRALEQGIAAFKRAGRFRAGANELDPCAGCGHERRQHLDPRWPCNMLACGCRGFVASTRALP